MEMDNAIRELCFRGASLDEIRRCASGSGALHTLLADGARKVDEGKTSVTEVMRVTRLAAGVGA
jgi:type II secretory ATPase GspE/PulE/Tfp pilus assembly ATPase PilB-like protein